MPKIKFTDLKTKLKFETDEFEIKTTKKGGKYAVAIAPSGAKSSRFISKEFAEERELIIYNFYKEILKQK